MILLNSNSDPNFSDNCFYCRNWKERYLILSGYLNTEITLLGLTFKQSNLIDLISNPSPFKFASKEGDTYNTEKEKQRTSLLLLLLIMWN